MSGVVIKKTQFADNECFNCGEESKVQGLMFSHVDCQHTFCTKKCLDSWISECTSRFFVEIEEME